MYVLMLLIWFVVGLAVGLIGCGECLLRFGFGVGCFALLFVYRFAVYAVLVDW